MVSRADSPPCATISEFRSDMRRLPVYLLIDCSESMAGAAIDAVNVAVTNMVRDLLKRPHALETVAISLIAFAGRAKQVVPLTALDLFKVPPLSVSPGTSLGRALDLLASCIETEVVKNTKDRKGDWRPLVFLFTDGQPTDDWRSTAKRLKTLNSPRIANIYAIGCGEDVDFSVLTEITDIVFKVKDMDVELIRKTFVWITASVQNASTSAAAGITELPALPADYDEALKMVTKEECVPLKEPHQVFIHARCSKTKDTYLMRYLRKSDRGQYTAVAAHKLEGGGMDAYTSPPAVNSAQLNGVPDCPYCGNPSAAVCGFCGGIMCFNQKQSAPPVCPHCGNRQEGGFITGDFGVRQSVG